MKKNVLLLMILGLMISLVGCRTPMQTSSTSPSEDSGKANDNGPAILFVSGTISFDSIANAYHIKPVVAVLTDMNGRKVVQGSFDNTNYCRLNTAQLPSGVYVLQILQDNQLLYTNKVLKRRLL